MEAKTAAAMGSRRVGVVGWVGWVVDEAMGVGVVVVMAFSVRARMAFWDFLVPKARPRVVRAERRCVGGRLVDWLWGVAREGGASRTLGGASSISGSGGALAGDVGRKVPRRTRLRASTTCKSPVVGL